MLAGPVMMTRFFQQELEQRGHQVRLIGPRDPDTQPDELPQDSVLCPALSFPHYKGFNVPLPVQPELFTRDWPLDVILGQSNSLFLHLGVWLRQFHGIPLLATNTIHMPSYAQHILSDRMLATPWIRAPIDWRMNRVELDYVTNLYNHTDGVIVLSRFLVPYWRDRGVTAPIHVIPRPVRPELFDRPTKDPFPGNFGRGGRIVTVCRQSREKSLDRLIRVFAAYIEPVVPGASLTLIGDGPEHLKLQGLAQRLGVADRVLFTGMIPQENLVDYYRNGDLFAYTSLSETFGCVVSEALWCGLPTVAFDDQMGVAHQVRDRQNGRLIPTQGFADSDADLAYGRAATEILTDQALRCAWSEEAARLAHAECAPERIMQLTLEAFEAAIQHRRRTLPEPAAQRGTAQQAMVTWRNVHLWLYQNAAFWMMGQFFRSKPQRVPDVLAETVKMPRQPGVPARGQVPGKRGPNPISMVS
jgi:glycosyltransferase involved in cell wall biosynthesis